MKRTIALTLLLSFISLQLDPINLAFADIKRGEDTPDPSKAFVGKLLSSTQNQVEAVCGDFSNPNHEKDCALAFQQALGISKKLLLAAPLHPGKPGLTSLYLLTMSRLTTPTEMQTALTQLGAGCVWAEPNLPSATAMIPDDYFYSMSGSWGEDYDDLWALKPAKMDAEHAWDDQAANLGDGTIVAVIDSGIDYTHEDLAQNIWVNPGEDLNGNGTVDASDRNGIDDDLDGYIDDFWGWDFFNGDNNPIDDNGHGTHVAGAIAATGNNLIGIIGVAPRAKIMVLKTFDSHGAGREATHEAAIRYAMEHGAKIINCSWSGAGFSNLLNEAFIDARAAGILSVGAAGNNNADAAGYHPGNIESVMAIGATTQLDEKLGMSNFGNKVALSAPGGGYDSEPGGDRNVLSTLPDGTELATADRRVAPGYYRLRGTSRSTAYASGVAALIAKKYPTLTPDQIQERLAATTDPFPTDPAVSIGLGRLNANRAVTLPEGPLFRMKEIRIQDTNGDGIFDPGEQGTISVKVQNTWRAASLVAATLTTSSTAATISNGSHSFGPFASREIKDNTGNPFIFQIRPDAPAADIVFAVTITADGSTQIFDTPPIHTAGPGNQAPILDPVGDRQMDEGETLNIQLSATDPDADALTFSASNLPPGAVFNATNNTFTWTPTLRQFGIYSVTFTVTDGELTDAETIQITVHDINTAPVLDPVGNRTINENDRLLIQLTATDAQGDPLTFSASNLPSGAVFNATNNTFAWTPSYQQFGTYQVTFRVTDGLLADEETITITVNDINTAPVLNPIGDRTINEGDPLAIVLSAVDAERDRLTFSTGVLPSAAVFNATNNTLSWTPSHRQHGTYTVMFRVTDGALSDEETITIIVNDVNAAPVLNAIGNQSVNEGVRLRFVISAADDDGDPLGYYTSAPLPPGSVFNANDRSFTWTPTASQSGTYTVTFFVTDNLETDSETIQIIVQDILMNHAPVVSPLLAQQIFENQNLSLTITASDPDTGDQALLAFQAAGLPAGASFDPATHVFNWTPTYDQAGEYTVNFTATDPGGLSDTKTLSIRVLHENRAPILDPIGNKSVQEGNPLSFIISGSDPDGDSITFSASSLPAGASFNPSTRTFSWTPGSSQQGTYQVIFRVSDGLLSASETITIAVGNVNRPPDLSPIGNRSVNEGQALSFTISATDPDGDSLTYSASSLPAGAAFDAAARTFSWTPDFNQSGSYTVTFSVTDGAESDSETITITANNINQAPLLDPIGDRSVNEGANLNFTVSATDPDGGTLTYSTSALPTGATFNAATRTFNWTPTLLQSGSYPVTFTVTDGSFSDSEAMTIVVGNVNQPPVLDAIGNKSVDEGANLNFVISASDPDGGTLTYSTSALPTGATFNAATRIFSWTPTSSQSGTYSVTFTVSDGALSDSETATITVGNINQAPVLNSIPNQSANENQLVSFAISAVDPDNDPLIYSASNLPSGAAFNVSTRTFSWTPSYTQAGNYSVTFTVTDGTLSDSKTASIAVANINRAPTLNPIGDKSTTEGQLLSFVVNGSDPDADVLTFSATGLPTGATFNAATRTFSWTPGFDQADSRGYSVTFRASDGALSASEIIRIDVANANRAPVINAVSAQTVNEGQLLTFTVSATDPDADGLTYSASGLPSGSTFNASTRTFSWTPSFTQAGNYAVTFTASDGSLTDSKTASITVANINRAPTLTAIPSQSVNEGNLLSLAVSGSDPDGGTLTYSASNLPSGAVFTASTRVFSWTPSFSQAGTYSVIFTVSDGALSDSKTATILVVNINRAPVMAAIPNQSVNAGSSLSFIVSASDPDGNALTYSASNLPQGASFNASTRTFAWTPTTSQGGLYQPSFSVTDGALSDSETASITVIRANGAPVIDPLPDHFLVYENQYVTFQAHATDPDGDTLTYTINGVPAAGSYFNSSTGQLIWMPTKDQANGYAWYVYYVTVCASDGQISRCTDTNIQVVNLECPFQYGQSFGNLFVRQIFRDLMHRDPDADTERAWGQALDDGTLTRAQAILSILNSAEYQQNEGFAIRAYSIVGRRADKIGFLNSTWALRGGAGQEALVGGFITSSEFTGGATLTNPEFVTRLYQNILGRTPAPSELTPWVNALNAGTYTRAQAAKLILDSTESLNRHAKSVFVQSLYLDLLQREAATSEFDQWIAQLNGGMSQSTAATGFLGSDEYALRFGCPLDAL